VSALAAMSLGGTPLADVKPLEGSNPLLEASPGLMIWTLVCFFITLFILKRYVFGPIGQAIEKRRSQIAATIAETEASREEALRLLEEYRERLAEARREAEELRERGRRDAERQRQEILSRATEERERVLADQQAQLDAQVRQAVSEMRGEVVGLALAAAEKVTRKSLDDADHRRLIEEAIGEADLSSLGSGNGSAPAGNGSAPGGE
jgi:F-type H+-transporting ATPase subunit b